MHKLTAKCCYIWAVTVNLVSVAAIQPVFVLSGEIGKVASELVNSSAPAIAQKDLFLTQLFQFVMCVFGCVCVFLF